MSISTSIRDDDLADLMTEIGTTGALTQVTGGTFNPATNSVSGASTANYTVTGIIRRPKREFMAGTIVTDDRIRFTITASGLAVVPAIGDTLTLSGTVYTVEELETVKPAGTAIAYTLFLR
jgi:hypothetical protein